MAPPVLLSPLWSASRTVTSLSSSSSSLVCPSLHMRVSGSHGSFHHGAGGDEDEEEVEPGSSFSSWNTTTTTTLCSSSSGEHGREEDFYQTRGEEMVEDESETCSSLFSSSSFSFLSLIAGAQPYRTLDGPGLQLYFEKSAKRFPLQRLPFYPSLAKDRVAPSLWNRDTTTAVTSCMSSSAALEEAEGIEKEPPPPLQQKKKNENEPSTTSAAPFCLPTGYPPHESSTGKGSASSSIPWMGDQSGTESLSSAEKPWREVLSPPFWSSFSTALPLWYGQACLEALRAYYTQMTLPSRSMHAMIPAAEIVPCHTFADRGTPLDTTERFHDEDTEERTTTGIKREGPEEASFAAQEIRRREDQFWKSVGSLDTFHGTNYYYEDTASANNDAHQCTSSSSFSSSFAPHLPCTAGIELCRRHASRSGLAVRLTLYEAASSLYAKKNEEKGPQKGYDMTSTPSPVPSWRPLSTMIWTCGIEERGEGEGGGRGGGGGGSTAKEWREGVIQGRPWDAPPSSSSSSTNVAPISFQEFIASQKKKNPPHIPTPSVSSFPKDAFPKMKNPNEEGNDASLSFLEKRERSETAPKITEWRKMGVAQRWNEKGEQESDDGWCHRETSVSEASPPPQEGNEEGEWWGWEPISTTPSTTFTGTIPHHHLPPKKKEEEENKETKMERKKNSSAMTSTFPSSTWSVPARVFSCSPTREGSCTMVLRPIPFTGGFCGRLKCIREVQKKKRTLEKTAVEEVVVPPWTTLSYITELCQRLEDEGHLPGGPLSFAGGSAAGGGGTTSTTTPHPEKRCWWMASFSYRYVQDLTPEGGVVEVECGPPRYYPSFRLPPWRAEIGLPPPPPPPSSSPSSFLDGSTTRNGNGLQREPKRTRALLPPCVEFLAQIRQGGEEVLAGHFFFFLSPSSLRAR